MNVIRFRIIALLCILFSFSGGKASNEKIMMEDKQQIEQAYKDMYTFMVGKDSVGLSKILSDDFVLVHMTGMQQPKTIFIQAILNGVLNYYEYNHEKITVRLDGDTATLCGQTRVLAAVFGGGKHTWSLQQKLELRKQNGHWLITRAVASTY